MKCLVCVKCDEINNYRITTLQSVLIMKISNPFIFYRASLLVVQAILLIGVNSCYADNNDKIEYENYVLIMSENDQVCRHMGKIFNDDVTRYGHVKYDSHPKFNAIKWSMGSYYYFQPSNGIKKNKGVIFSKFDINNDGSYETILKEEKYLFGDSGDQIIVIDNDNYNFLEKPELPVEVHAKLPGIKLSAKWPYKLNMERAFEGFRADEKYSENNILKLMVIHPFIFNDTVYLSMKEILRIENRPLWHVIAKYTDDTFSIPRTIMLTNKIEPICYFDHKEPSVMETN